MAPIVKDPDTLTTSEAASRPGSAARSDSPTRPQPVALELPITVNGVRTVEGSDKREPFSESTKTVMVHGNGAVIKLHSALAPGQLLFLTNERTKKEVVCQVVKSKHYRNVSGYVELEFTEPALGFWGMRFPGDGVAPGPSHAAPGNGSRGLPAAPRMDQPAAGTVDRKPSAAAPALPKPAPAVGSLFASEEPLVEPWLKKRAPVSRISPEPPRAARPEPVEKTELPTPSQPPVRNFELARPSDKPASLFAPYEPTSNPATVDSTVGPFFEVKPEPPDLSAAAAPTAPAASDPETEEAKRHTTRLEDELPHLGFAEPAKPTIEAPPVTAEESSSSVSRAERVDQSAAELVAAPVESGAPAALPETGKLAEPLESEPPAPIPAFDSLEGEELKIPAWLAPLAQNASAPSSTKELILGEKAKRIAEQQPLEQLMAPLAAPVEQQAADSRAPQFPSMLPFEGLRKARENTPRKSGKSKPFAVLGAVMVVLASGGWWYKNRQADGARIGLAARQDQAPPPVETNSPEEARLARPLPVHDEPESAAATPDAGNPSAPENAARAGKAPGPVRDLRAAANSAKDGTPVVTAETSEPEAAREKKPVLGEVHLAAPRISAKRTAGAGAEAEAGISLNGEPPEGDGNALGAGLGASGKQPAAPAPPAAVGGEVRQARLVSSVPPEYPSLAKAQHVSGGVEIDALIDSNGRVTEMKVLRGPTLLQPSAMEALRHWRYEPATLDGKAVPMHLTVTVQFRLRP